MFANIRRSIENNFALFLRFMRSGAMGFIVATTILYLLTHFLKMNPFLARIYSFLAGVLVTWQLNSRYTFRQVQTGKKMWRQGQKYYTFAIMSGAINYVIYSLCLLLWPIFYHNPVLAVVPANAASMIFNFICQKHFVFKEKAESLEINPDIDADPDPATI